MVKGLYTAYTGMINEQHRMDVLTNNLANANTNGYKKEGATAQAFSDQLALKIKDYTDAPFTARGLGIINPGVKIGEGYVDWSEGKRNPKILKTEDYKRLICSGKLMARKFDNTVDAGIIEKLRLRISEKHFTSEG